MKWVCAVSLVLLSIAVLLASIGCANRETTPPSEPSNLAKSTPDSNTPTFTWEAATDDDSGVAGYLVRIDGGKWIDIGDVTTYTFEDAIADGTHTFEVKAVDEARNKGTAASLTFTFPPPILSVGELAAKVSPSVVHIVADYRTWHSSGTGSVVNENGYVITNKHVVEKGYYATTRFSDGTQLQASIVYRDPTLDLAILKCPSDNFTALKLGGSTTPALGDDVVAIGFPSSAVLGESPSVSKGIISAFRTYNNTTCIQTDASASPGSSGGPLVNMRGEAIGVVTWKVAEGINLAIDVDSVKTHVQSVVQQLEGGQLKPIEVPEQVATLEGNVILEYHGKGVSQTPAFAMVSSTWKILFKPEFDGRVGLYAGESSEIVWGPWGWHGPTCFSSEVTRGRMYETWVYGSTGNSVIIGTSAVPAVPSDGEWTIWVVEESASVSSLPFTYTGEGGVFTPPFQLEAAKTYKLTFVTTWDGDIGIGSYNSDHDVNLARTYSVQAGVTSEDIWYRTYSPTEAVCLSIELTPPMGHWTVSVSEVT